jgi:DEAD/DEAH box helicase domain-containing protein
MTYRLIYKHKEIGTISDVHLFHEAYVGAIYRHFGKSYLVTAHTADEVLLEDADPHLRTEGIFYTVIQEGEILSGLRYGENLVTCYGKLTIFDNFAGFRVVDTRTGEVRDEFRSQLARSSNVRGFWLQITDTSSLGCLTDIQHLFGLEQLLRIGAPFIVPCDRHDLGTLTSKPTTVYLYETVPGGIGIAEKALEVWPEIINTALDIAEQCSCKHGCPSCIVPPRLPPNFDEPRKEPAIAIGRRLLSLIETLPCEQYDPSTHMWIPLSQ